jgi:hypothetical protein
MPNRIPTPRIAPVGVKSSAVDNSAVNTKQYGTAGGVTKGATKATGPKDFNKVAK